MALAAKRGPLFRETRVMSEHNKCPCNKVESTIKKTAELLDGEKMVKSWGYFKPSILSGK